MLFNSYIFIFVFFPIVFIGYFTLNKWTSPKLAKLFLIGSSIVFYGYWNVSYVPLILISVVVNFTIGKGIHLFRAQRKIILTIGILFNVALLGYYKYYDFFISSINTFFATNLTLLNLALPLAISFFTFQQIAFLVDSYRGETKGYSFFDYILFVTFFPQLIAGPIVHHKEMMPQFEEKSNKRIIPENISKGLYIFMIGLFKKVFIADQFGLWANDGYSNVESLTVIDSWITTLSYTFQLYFDFSAYCDMAIGLGLILNIKLPINFYSPYKALNIQDFWRRWHMTLNRFLTQYLYIPLGGSRKGEVLTYINIFIVFFVSGFWHGAGWTFVVWGILHGVASMIYRAWKKVGKPLPKWLAWFTTFMFVHLAWVFFRAPSLDASLQMLSKMFSFSELTFPVSISNLIMKVTGVQLQLQDLYFDYSTVVWIGFAFVIVLFTKNSIQKLESFVPSTKNAIFIAVLFIISVIYMERVSEFLYFNF